MLSQSIANRRIQTVLFLGFSSGLPLALTSSSLQAWFTEAGVDLMMIGSLTLLGLPYVWKFLWAPLLDRFVPPFLGRRRGWILLTQISLCLTIFIIAQMNPAKEPNLIGILALIIAFVSATQDIANDAYRTDILLPEQRGLGAAVFTFGFRVAMLISGGLALVMADYLGWKATYEMMALFMALSIIATFFAPKEQSILMPQKTFFVFLVESFRDLLTRKKIAYLLLFIMIYKIGDAFALALMSNFLLGELGFSLTEVGIAFKTFGLIATLLGVFVGGLLLVRINIFYALISFGLLQAFSNAMFIILAILGKKYYFMTTCIFLESFFSGMSTAAFVAFLMSLCNPKYTATQYAFLSALFALGRVFAGPIAAFVVQSFGWINFYWFAFLLSFPGVILLTTLRRNVGLSHAEVVT